jgi:hypothetical protein
MSTTAPTTIDQPPGGPPQPPPDDWVPGNEELTFVPAVGWNLEDVDVFNLVHEFGPNLEAYSTSITQGVVGAETVGVQHARAEIAWVRT